MPRAVRHYWKLTPVCLYIALRPVSLSDISAYFDKWCLGCLGVFPYALQVSSELHEGLLQCLVQLANDEARPCGLLRITRCLERCLYTAINHSIVLIVLEAGRVGILPRARELAELCRGRDKGDHSCPSFFKNIVSCSLSLEPARCASHLLQTPSAQPLYVRQAKAL